MKESSIYMLRGLYANERFSAIGDNGYVSNITQGESEFGSKIAKEISESYRMCPKDSDAIYGIWIPSRSGILNGCPYGSIPGNVKVFLIPLFQSSIEYEEEFYESKPIEFCFNITEYSKFKHMGGAGIYAFVTVFEKGASLNLKLPEKTISYSEIIEKDSILSDKCNLDNISIPSFKIFKHLQLLQFMIDSIGMYPNTMDKLSGTWNTNFFYANGLVNPKAHRNPLSHLTSVGLEVEIERFNENNDYIVSGIELEEFEDCSVAEHTDTINFDTRRIRLFVPVGEVSEGSYVKIGENVINLVSGVPIGFDCTKPHSAEIKGKMNALIIDMLPKESTIAERISYMIQPLGYYMEKENE